MNPPSDPWSRLLARARQVPADARPVHAPFGFATRVAAQAFERVERPLIGLFDRFSWRALGLAAGVAVASVALNVAPVLRAFEHHPIVEQDPVALVLELR